MFYRYEIKNNGKEDILYLYLTMSYEFSKELTNNSSDEDIARRTNNFINNNNIKFNGDKVYLVIDGIVVKTLKIKNSGHITNINNDSIYSNNNYLLKLKLEDNSMTEITLKEYLLGVLPNNFFPFIEDETLKALCVLYRTYAYYMMKTKGYVEVYSSFAMYKSINYYKIVWLKDFDIIKNRLEKIIDTTNSIFLSYKSQYILPFIHFSNVGKTLDNNKYPYLSSVNSLWDLSSPYYLEIIDIDYKYISKLLQTEINYNCKVKLLEIDKNNFIKKISFNDKVFTGEEIRSILNLKSLEMIFIFNKKSLKIITKGCGNSLGLSIYGANELAKNDCSYLDIIKYYFPVVDICRYVKELS